MKLGAIMEEIGVYAMMEAALAIVSALAGVEFSPGIMGER